MPFERLVEVLSPARSQARHPLFQVALTAEISGRRELEFSGVKAVAAELEVPVAKFDLELMVSENPEGSEDSDVLSATFTYATDLFDPATVNTFATRFVRILDAVATRPETIVGDIDLLSRSERTDLTVVAADDTMPPRQSLVDIFLSGTAEADSVAVRFEGRSITYRELDEQSSKLARVLIGRGAGPRDHCCSRLSSLVRDGLCSMGGGEVRGRHTSQSTRVIRKIVSGTCWPILRPRWDSRRDSS